MRRSALAGACLVAAAAAAAAASLWGCQAVLGIHDVGLDPGAGGGGTGGGAPKADFVFTVGLSSVDIPYENTSYAKIPVTITPQGGFAGKVLVVPDGAPQDLVSIDATIPPGSTEGVLQLGATKSLTLGTSFDLTLLATSGSISHSQTIHAFVAGVPGTLDPTFGAAGVSSTTLGSYGTINSLLSTPGKILAAGSFQVTTSGPPALMGVRLSPDGSVDTGFGAMGHVSYSPPSVQAGEARSVLLTSTGVTLLAGWYSSPGVGGDIVLARYRDDGTPEQVGTDQGIVLESLLGNERVLAAALTASDGVVLTGARTGQLYVARFADRFGTLDTTFAGSGWLDPLEASPVASGGNAIALDEAGRALVAGYVTTAAGSDVVLLRLTIAGALDTTFGTNGVTQVPLPGDQEAYAITLQPDGAILVAAGDGGSSGDAGVTPPGILVLRFTAAGALDPSFGAGGVVAQPTAIDPSPVGMVRLPDGRVVVSGNVAGAELVRLQPNGSLDATFGTGGVATPDLGSQVYVGTLAPSSDGKLLVGGRRAGKSSGVVDVFVARLFN